MKPEGEVSATVRTYDCRWLKQEIDSYLGSLLKKPRSISELNRLIADFIESLIGCRKFFEAGRIENEIFIVFVDPQFADFNENIIASRAFIEERIRQLRDRKTTTG